MRLTVAIAIACFTLVEFTAAGETLAAVKRYQLNIPSQTLDGALKDLAQQTGLQVARFSDAASGDTIVTPITGTLTADQALNTLLVSTKLIHKPLNDHAYIILAAQELRTSVAVSSAADVGASNTQQKGEGADAGAKESDPAAMLTLEEIVVTAQKRTERLMDVPVPVSIITAAQLRDENRLRLADYYSQVPGLSYAGDPVGGSTAVSIRGLSSGVTYNVNPTVGFTIDDVPYGSAKSDGGSYALPEIDPGDLERLEVLRGPQGTLYGASSLGGLIKYVTVEPSLDAMKGQVSVGSNAIKNGDNPGYKAYGSINLPVADTLAVRASGFVRSTPGYVENPLRGFKNIGEARGSGGRLATLWQPSDIFSVKLAAFYQDIEQHGAIRFANPTSPYDASRGLAGALGYLQQDDVPGTGGTETRNRGFNLTMRARFGGAELTSITGHNTTDFRNLVDDQRDFAWATAMTETIFGPTVPNDSTRHTFDSRHDLKKWTQELRLSMPLGQRVDMLFGAFYTDEDYTGHFISRFVNPATAQEVAIRDIGEVTFGYTEWAGFADFTVHFTDQFDVQVGGRRSRNESTYQGTNLGPQIGGVALGAPTIGPTFESSEYVSTYLVTPRYQFTRDLMLYARFSTGYRPGGYNPLNEFNKPYPPYGSDSSKNYELGLKSTLFGGAVTVDASVYRIDWNNMQLQVLPPGSFWTVTENSGVAKSQGVELSLEVRPTQGLKLSGWVALNDAKLTADFPPTATAAGKQGDRLPISSKLSGSFSVTQEFLLVNEWTGFVGGTYTYVGDRLGNFTSYDAFGVVPPRDRFGSYKTIDLRTGIHNAVWSADLYVANVADSHGIIYGDKDYLVPIKPREVGLNVSRQF